MAAATGMTDFEALPSSRAEARSGRGSVNPADRDLASSTHPASSNGVWKFLEDNDPAGCDDRLLLLFRDYFGGQQAC